MVLPGEKFSPDLITVNEVVMTTASSTLFLDLGNTSATQTKSTNKSPLDMANGLTDKGKSFSSIYSDKLQARDDYETRLADLTAQKQLEADRAKSREDRNQRIEKSKKDDKPRQDEVASGEDLPPEKVAEDRAPADKLQKDGDQVRDKDDDSMSAETEIADDEGKVGNADTVVLSVLSAANGEGSDKGDGDVGQNTGGEDSLQELVDSLALADGSEGATGDELVEDFITALAAIYAGKSGVEGDAAESETSLSDELTTGDVKKSLGQLLQNLMRGQNSGDAASDENKGADVSQLFKDMIGKVMSKEIAGTTDSGKDNLDTLLAKLGDTAQARPLTQMVPGQLAMQMNSARADSSLNVPYVTSLQQAVTHPEFKDGMAQKLVWMVGQNIQSAKVHLNPAELGPIEMKIQVSKDQAHIQVHSPHAVTRDLMEGTVHRLREMLAEQGIELSQFDVSSQQGEQSGAEGSGQGGSDSDLAGSDIIDGEVQIVEQTLSSDQLVDTYA